MRTQPKGFTLIELMIMVMTLVAVIAIIGAILLPAFTGSSQSVNTINGDSNSVQTVLTQNGVIQTKCIGDYLFVIGADGSARQVINDSGHGTSCTPNSKFE